MLDVTCPIPLGEFQGLTGKYIFPEAEYQRCQLQENGSVCRQEHGRGWIAKRKDGKEGYIGRNCAHDHFGADKNFAEETRRINRELRIDALVQRLEILLQDPAMPARLLTARGRQESLLERIVNLRNTWPEQLLSQLQSMTKGIRRDVRVEVCYVEYDEDKKRNVYEWVPTTVGSLTGIEGLDAPHVRQIGHRLSKAAEAKINAHADREQSERSMREWAEALEDVSRCEAELIDREATCNAFCQPDNLNLLWLLLRSEVDQRAAVQCALELVSGLVVTDQVAAQTRKAWQQAIRAANGGRDFRCMH